MRSLRLENRPPPSLIHLAFGDALMMLRIGPLVLSLVLLFGVELRADQPPLRVVATTGMVAEMVREVAGEHAQVEALMGPGVDPHLYKVTQGDVGRLSRAELIVFNGWQLEGKMGAVLARLGASRATLALAEQLPRERLLEDPTAPGVIDPHVWFDVGLWAEGVPAVVEKLAALCPQHRAEFAARGEQYAQRLRALHEWVAEQIATIPSRQRVLVTAHDAFRYFSRAYDIEVAALLGLSTTSEYGLHDVRRIVDLVVARGIPAVFVEASVPQRFVVALREGAKARGFALEVGGELYSDALGPHGSGAEEFEQMVRHNVRTIVQGLLRGVGATTPPRR